MNLGVPAGEDLLLYRRLINESYLTLGHVKRGSGHGIYREKFSHEDKEFEATQVTGRFQVDFRESMFHLQLGFEEHPYSIRNLIILGTNSWLASHAWKEQPSKRDHCVLTSIENEDVRPIRHHCRFHPARLWHNMCDLARFPENRWAVTGKIANLITGVTYLKDGKTVSSNFLVDVNQGYRVVLETIRTTITGQPLIRYQARWKETEEGWFCDSMRIAERGKFNMYRKDYAFRWLEFTYDTFESQTKAEPTHFTLDAMRLIPGTTIADVRKGSLESRLKYKPDEEITQGDLDSLEMPELVSEQHQPWNKSNYIICGLTLLGVVCLIPFWRLLPHQSRAKLS